MADSAPPKVPRPVDVEWVTGKLLSHGKSPYRGDPQNGNSYYVRLLTRETDEGARLRREYQDRAGAPIDGHEEHLRVTRDSGGTRTLWGVDLERAIRESRSHVQVGQEVGVRSRENRPVFDGAGNQIPDRHKKIYEVERLPYIRAREANLRKLAADHREGLRLNIDDPEARGEYRLLSAAADFARRKFPNDEESQDRFVNGVKRVMEQSPEREKLIAEAASRIGDIKRSTAGPNTDKPNEAAAEREQPNTPLTLE
jgi:hypothetical protein